MNRIGRAGAGLLAALLLTGCAELERLRLGTGGPLDTGTIVAGLKEALEVGTRNAVRQTSRPGGYLDDLAIRIPLPPDLKKPADTLRKVGLGSLADRLVEKMNEAAEHAAAEAAPVFVDAITAMTFDDARRILQGSDTEATDYFRAKTTEPLTRRYAPIVARHMSQLGLVRQYNAMMEQYAKIPFAPEIRFRIEEYVVEKALEGLFHVVAGEERKIRKDPAARVTELLRKVFGRR